MRIFQYGFWSFLLTSLRRSPTPARLDDASPQVVGHHSPMLPSSICLQAHAASAGLCTPAWLGMCISGRFINEHYRLTSIPGLFQSPVSVNCQTCPNRRTRGKSPVYLYSVLLNRSSPFSDTAQIALVVTPTGLQLFTVYSVPKFSFSQSRCLLTATWRKSFANSQDE